MAKKLPQTGDTHPNPLAPLRCAKSRRGKREASRRGFTLVEMMIVVGIIMTLTAIATPSFLQSLANAKYARAVGDIHALQTDILTYSFSNGTLPDTLADVGRGGLLDPWGMPYIYTNYALPGTKNLIRKDHFLHPLNSDFDLSSSGPDKQWKAPLTAKASQDDVIRANDGAYIGRASEY